jgi:uncharacterized protein DUF4260
VHTAHLTAPTRRIAYAALASALLAAAIVVIARDGHLWQFFAFGAAPDLALFVGIGSGLAKGQLHPRAVPLYNALHRFAGPIILALIPGMLVGALAWGLHIAIDRTVGYGLRTRDGFQRA